MTTLTRGPPPSTITRLTQRLRPWPAWPGSSFVTGGW